MHPLGSKACRCRLRIKCQRIIGLYESGIDSRRFRKSSRIERGREIAKISQRTQKELTMKNDLNIDSCRRTNRS